MFNKTKGIINDEGRTCTKCGLFKPWSEYWKKFNGCKGRATICKDCGHISNVEYKTRLIKSYFCDERRKTKEEPKEIIKVKEDICPEITPEMCPGYVYREESNEELYFSW